MTLTREEAIRIHRDMWRYLKEHGAGKGTIERGELKHDYCLTHGYNFKYNCVLCEYADSYGGCCACPAIWGSEDEWRSFFCEGKGREKDVEEGHIDWRYSNLDDIINIKMKGE